MTLDEIRELLDCHVICGQEQLNVDVESCFAADLMSDVLAFSRPGGILLTGLANVQAVHTADVADLRAILFVHDKRPPDPVIELARSRQIPLLSTAHLMYESCGLLHRRGLKGGSR
ncbi:MAG: hypothetical protein KBD01_14930 [Acidobacteria bacterium]|nr:hypothetical protein [Acidobacteriota bacterium]